MPAGKVVPRFLSFEIENFQNFLIIFYQDWLGSVRRRSFLPQRVNRLREDYFYDPDKAVCEPENVVVGSEVHCELLDLGLFLVDGFGREFALEHQLYVCEFEDYAF